jgi:hypothetical protein
MKKHKGRAITYLAMFAAMWVAGRVVMRQPAEYVFSAAHRKSTALDTQIARQLDVGPSVEIGPINNSPAHYNITAAKWATNIPRAPSALQTAQQSHFASEHKSALPSIALAPYLSWPTPIPQPSAIPIMASKYAPFSVIPIAIANNRDQKARYYAYSFWRIDIDRKDDVSAIEFGSSQSGFIAEIPIRLRKLSHANTAILLRGFTVLNDPRQNEFGIGMRWRLSHNTPITFSIEQRIRTDGQQRQVAYIAASPPTIKLGSKLQIHSYAQIGVSNGPSNVAFADMQARVDMPVLKKEKVQIALAPIAVMNVYNDRYRLDIGPSLSSNIAIRGAQFRLSADWRLQIAGDAPRKSGATVTVSSSF